MRFLSLLLEGGGCTQSYPVNVRTHAMVPEGQQPPEATPVSQTLISVAWQAPQRPNGPNIKYELSRLLIRQPLDRKLHPVCIRSRLFTQMQQANSKQVF